MAKGNMKTFTMQVPVHFTVTVQAKDRESAIRKYKRYVLLRTVDLGEQLDLETVTWSKGQSWEDMDWDSFAEKVKEPWE